MQSPDATAAVQPPTCAPLPSQLVSWYASQDISEADSPELTPDQALAALKSVVRAGETPAVIDMYERACWHCGLSPDDTAAAILSLRS